MKVFLAYSPEDEDLKNELEEHLSLLQKQKTISVWNAGKIAAGEDIGVKTAEQIRAARILLLLISSDFLASDLTEHPDIKNVLSQQHGNDSVRVIPVILRDCVWRVGELAHLKPLPENGYAIANTKYWANRDEAFKQVAIGLQKVVANMEGGSYSYPSGKLTETVSDIGSSFWQRYRRFIGSGTAAVAILALAIFLLIRNFYGGGFIDDYQYRKRLEGTWVNLQYFQEMLLVAKLVFRDGNVEVYSKDKGRELYWGKQAIKVKNGKITVTYPDWDISLQIEPQAGEKGNTFGSLVTIYRLNDAESGLNVVNDTLIRPLVALKKHSEDTSKSGMSAKLPPSPTPADTTIKGRNTLPSTKDTKRTAPADTATKDTSAAKGTVAKVDKNIADSSLVMRPVLKAVLDKMTDSMATKYYNIAPIETLQVSPIKRLDWTKNHLKNTRRPNE